MKKSKRILAVALMMVLSIHAVNAQLTKDQNLSRFDDRPLHFGFYLGVNAMDYRFLHYDNVMMNPVFAETPGLDKQSEPYYRGIQSWTVECYPIKPGFSVGGVVNFRMNDVIDFRCTPGMSLGARQLKFSSNINTLILDTQAGGRLYPSLTYDRYMTTPSAYIDLPVGFRYKGSRFGNVRPYIYGGAAYKRDLENKRISESAVHLKRNGYYAEVALGLDSYFPYFRFTSEFRFSYGLNNLIRHDADLMAPEVPNPFYGYILKELNSNIFSLIVFFE